MQAIFVCYTPSQYTTLISQLETQDVKFRARKESGDMWIRVNNVTQLGTAGGNNKGDINYLMFHNPELDAAELELPLGITVMAADR